MAAVLSGVHSETKTLRKNKELAQAAKVFDSQRSKKISDLYDQHDWIAEYDFAKDNQKSSDVPVGRSRFQDSLLSLEKYQQTMDNAELEFYLKAKPKNADVDSVEKLIKQFRENLSSAKK